MPAFQAGVLGSIPSARTILKQADCPINKRIEKILQSTQGNTRKLKYLAKRHKKCHHYAPVGLHFDKEKKRWIVSFSILEGNIRKRKRKNFKSKQEANNFLYAQTSQKKKYGQVTSFDLDDYERLKTVESRLVSGTLEDAVNHYNKTVAFCDQFNLKECVVEYIKKKDCSAEHKINLKIYLNKLADHFSDYDFTDITSKEIYTFLEGLSYSKVYKNNMRRAFVTFWNYCVFNNLCSSNEAEKVPKFIEEKKEIEIIEVSEVKKLFNVLEDNYPELIPFNALRAFGGLRTDHAKTVDWSQINFEEKGIRFTGGGKRVISFLENYPENLWAWLKKYKEYKIKPTNARETGKVMSKHKIICPHNGLRHGFATYHLAKYKDINLTSLLLMHRGNPRMLFDRYRGVTSFCDAEQYFETFPS